MEHVHAIKVEGVGQTLGQYRFASGMPQGEVGELTQQLWVRSLLRIPQEVKTGVDIRAGSSSVGGMNFELILKDTPFLPIFTTKEARVLAYNASNMTLTSTSITLVNRDGSPATGLAGFLGTHLQIGREVIRIFNEGPPGVYDVARALFGTIAEPHGNGLTDDKEVFSAYSPSFIKTRVIEYCRYDAGGTIASEKVLWRGVISAVDVPNETVFITGDTPGALVRRKRLMNRIWQGVADEGSTAQSGRCTIKGNRLPIQGSNLASRRILVNIGGQTAAYVTLQIQGNGGFFEWGPNTDAVEYPGSPRFINLAKEGKGELRLWECMTTRPGAPDLLGATLDQNPFNLAMQLLTTTPGGGNGPYDIGNSDRPEIGDNMGCGVRADIVDIAGIERVRDRIGTMATLDAVLFADQGPDPFEAEDFIQKILRPFGCVLTQVDNLFMVVQLQDAVAIDAPRLTNDDFSIDQGAIPSSSPGRWSFEQLIVQYRQIFGREPIGQPIDDSFRRRRLGFGDADSEEIVIPSSSITLIASLGSYLVSRFHFDVSSIHVRLPYLPEYDFKLGDVVGFSEENTPNPQGENGTVDAALFITARRENLGEPLEYVYDCILFSGKYGSIGPSSQVEDGAYGPTEVLIYDNEFTIVSGPYENDLGGWAVGDVVDFLDGADMTVLGSATITAINDGGPGDRRLVFDTMPVPLSDEDLIVPTEYGLATDDQKDKWAYIALASGDLAGDDPDEWTT